MLTNLIPIIALFAALYLVIAIALQRRRDRLARERERTDRAGRPRGHERRRRHAAGGHADPLAYQKGEVPTAQEIVWLNTWLTDERNDN